jgi:hypothetical protein
MTPITATPGALLRLAVPRWSGRAATVRMIRMRDESPDVRHRLPLRQAIRRELGIGHADTGREPGEQLMGNGGLPVQVQAGPVTGKQPARAAPRPAASPPADDRTPGTNGELAATAFVMRRCHS